MDRYYWYSHDFAKGTYWLCMIVYEWDGGEYVMDDFGNLVRPWGEEVLS